MSKVQAVLFYKNQWTTKEARKWLKDNDFKPIKRVHKTKNRLRYRIMNPRLFKRFRIMRRKHGNKKLEFVIGFPGK